MIFFNFRTLQPDSAIELALKFYEMLKTCSECKSQQVTDKTAEVYYLITAILGVAGVIMMFVSWPWALLILTGMITSVVLAVDLPKRTYKCKNCGHEWKEGYNAAGEHSKFNPDDTVPRGVVE